MPYNRLPDEEISWLHHWVHEVLDNPQIAFFLVGAFIGWVMLWLRTIFVTHKVMRDMEKENVNAHGRIEQDLHLMKEDVSWIKGKIEGLHTDNNHERPS